MAGSLSVATVRTSRVWDVLEEPPDALHRVIRNAEPTREDFLSQKALGRAGTAKVTTVFEVLDTSSGNVVGAYRDVDEAINAIEQFAQKHGPSQPDDLALLEVDGRGEVAAAVASGRSRWLL